VIILKDLIMNEDEIKDWADDVGAEFDTGDDPAVPEDAGWLLHVEDDLIILTMTSFGDEIYGHMIEKKSDGEQYDIKTDRVMVQDIQGIGQCLRFSPIPGAPDVAMYYNDGAYRMEIVG
jgi:hypothetical protein